MSLTASAAFCGSGASSMIENTGLLGFRVHAVFCSIWILPATEATSSAVGLEPSLGPNSSCFAISSSIVSVLRTRVLMAKSWSIAVSPMVERTKESGIRLSASSTVASAT